MHCDVEVLNSYSKKLKVSLTAEELQPLETKVLKKYQRQSDIPGFRRGKAPLSMIKKRYDGMLMQDIVEEAINAHYNSALEESGLSPISQGKISNLEFTDMASGMVFEIEVEVDPEIELKNYKGLNVVKDVVPLSDEMVENNLQQLRDHYATSEEIETAAEEGHHVHFDAQELDEDGKPGKSEKHSGLVAELGSGKFDPEIEKQLIGVKAGDSLTVAQNTGTEEAPAETKLEISVKKVEKRDLPELNDDFVKNLEGDELNSLDELKERLRTNLQAELNYRGEQTLTNRIIDEMIKENPIEVPPTMVENYLDQMVKDFERQMQGRPFDENMVRNQYRPSAIHHVNWFYLRRELIKAENIEISDEEAIEFLEKSNMTDDQKERTKKDAHYLQHLKDDLIEEKLIKFLRENAKITEVNPMEQAAAAEAVEEKPKAKKKTNKKKTVKKEDKTEE